MTVERNAMLGHASHERGAEEDRVTDTKRTICLSKCDLNHSSANVDFIRGVVGDLLLGVMQSSQNCGLVVRKREKEHDKCTPSNKWTVNLKWTEQ